MSINCSFRIIIIYFCLYLSGLSVSAQVQVRNTIWNGEDFLSTPACRVVKEDSIRSLIFESVSYKDRLNLFLPIMLPLLCYKATTLRRKSYRGLYWYMAVVGQLSGNGL